MLACKAQPGLFVFVTEALYFTGATLTLVEVFWFLIIIYNCEREIWKEKWKHSFSENISNETYLQRNFSRLTIILPVRPAKTNHGEDTMGP